MASHWYSTGYAGLIAGDFVALGARDVGGIIQLGGTMLGSGRARNSKRRKVEFRRLETYSRIRLTP